MTSRTLRIGLVAGEMSGDQLGAKVMAALSARWPGSVFEGVGGPRMCERGLHSLYPMERLSVMGFAQPLLRLPELLRLRRRLYRHFAAGTWDLFLGIDAPAFNLPLARRLRRKGLPTAHLVSPSVWAWRAGRVHRIGASVDSMLCLFPFEPEIYTSRGIAASFVGHPLAQELEAVPDRAAARLRLGLPGQGPVLALLPGSRAAEVRLLAPLFMQTARRLAAQLPQLHCVLPVANDACGSALETVLESAVDLPLKTVQGSSTEAMAAADAVLLASGTATLEAALLRRPMAVAYRVDPLSAMLMSRLLRSPFVALPNVLAGRELVPELLQDAATPSALEAALLPLLHDGASADWLAEMDALRQSLSRDFGTEVVAALEGLVHRREALVAGSV